MRKNATFNTNANQVAKTHVDSQHREGAKRYEKFTGKSTNYIIQFHPTHDDDDDRTF